MVFQKLVQAESVIVSDPYETRRGQVIGEYCLIRKLGGGSFGAVYLAEHIHEHSPVAIKILQVPLSKSEDFRDFINEARTMIRLRHPHIILFLDVGLSREDFPFLVMEYASGGTLLDHHTKGSQLPLSTVVEYVEQIASALQYAHDHRVIHRDVKPANMLLRSDGTLLLSDFGIAKIMEQSTLMSMQKRTGTPAYMAPEQHNGYPCFASDQYSLAVVAYEWISGMRPFHGTSVGLVIQHMTASPPSLLNLLPTLPPAIEQVIFKALSKVPEQRFTTIQEFATAFRAAVQQANISQVDTKKLTLEEPPSKETQQPTTTASIHVEPQTNIPSLPQPSLANQSIEPDIAQIKQAPAQQGNPLPSNQPHPTAQTPILSSEAGNASRRLSPLGRNLILVGGAVLAVFLILVFVMNMMGAKPSHSPWTFPTGSAVSSSPAVVDGVLYVGSWDKNVHAIDARSGKQKWVFQTRGVVGSSPAVRDGIIYIGSNDGSVYAIDVQSHTQKWVFQTGDHVSSSPAVAGGVVYVGSDDDFIYAIDAQSGQKKWAFQTNNHVSSSPAVTGGVVYVGSWDKNVYAIDAQSGQKKWAFSTDSSVTSSPAVTGGVVYVGSNDKNIYAIDAQSGQKKWAFSTGDVVGSSPKVRDGVVYVGSNDKNIYAIDAQSGQKKWAFQTGDFVSSSPVVVDGLVYIGSNDKSIYAIDMRLGQKKWAFQTGGFVSSSPVVVNNVVYIGSEDGNVYAFGLPTAKS